MFTRRASDQEWVKYLLNTGLVTIDQYQTMLGGQNQVEVTELLVRHAHLFDNDTWVNRALQQDRFHYLPGMDLNTAELETFQQLRALLLVRCLNEHVLPLRYQNQILYLGLLRYDPEFKELNELLQGVPVDILVCLVPLGPSDFARLEPSLHSFAHRSH